MKIIYVSLIGLFLLAFVACGNTEPTDVPKFASGEATALVYNWALEDASKSKLKVNTGFSLRK